MARFCSVARGESPVIALAVHAGHRLRPELTQRTLLAPEARLREEDPLTGFWAAQFENHIVVRRSRFEVDVNRSREDAVYRGPSQAFGLSVWKAPLPDQEIERSLVLYDEFYRELRQLIESVIARYGRFLVLDLHSYNHRRQGPLAASAPGALNPDVNLGTGSLPRDRWHGVAERFVEELRELKLLGKPLTVGENVRFRGGYMSGWIHREFGQFGCALAIEVKKFFMNEWNGRCHHGLAKELGRAFRAVAPRLTDALRGEARWSSELSPRRTA